MSLLHISLVPALCLLYVCSMFGSCLILVWSISSLVSGPISASDDLLMTAKPMTISMIFFNDFINDGEAITFSMTRSNDSFNDGEANDFF